MDKLTKPLTAGASAEQGIVPAAAIVIEESAILARVNQGQTLPTSRAEQNKIGDAIGQNVYNRFGRSLSPADREMWILFNSTTARSDSRENNDRSRLNEAYDKFILENVPHYGVALLLDHDMMRRVFSWESGRPHLVRRFCEKLQRRTKVLRDETKHVPITKEHADLKREAVPELRRLFGKFKKQQTSRSPVTNIDLADFIQAERQGRPETWPRLLSYLTDLEAFIRDDKQNLAALILDGGFTAPTFIDHWFAVTHKYSDEVARKKLSQE